MELWLLTRPLFSRPNSHGVVFSHTLHLRHCYCLLLCRTHLPRRKLRMTHPKHTCQRRILLLHLHLPTYRTRPLLWLLPLQRNMEYWRSPTAPGDNNSFCGLRPPLRTDIILRGYSHHQPAIRRALCWKYPRAMNLRGLLRRQRHPNPILRLPLLIPVCHRGPNSYSPTLPPRNRLKQPPRTKLGHG